MGELSEEHGREVAQYGEGSGLVLHPRFTGMPVDHSARNEVENLLENAYIAAGWCLVVHNTPTEWQGFEFNTSSLFYSLLCHHVGWL